MAGKLTSPELRSYLAELVPNRPAEMMEMEAYAKEHSFPIIGPTAGYYCYQTARILGAKNIYELGSGFGYSTAWFAKAVQENGGGIVHHVVWDQALSDAARKHLLALGLDEFVEFTVGEATAALEKEEGPFDLIFNDINKEAYPKSLQVIDKKLRRGGILIVDNMLWGGRIFDSTDQSAGTNGIRELTRLLTDDPRWLSTLVPIRDGLIVALKN